MMKLANAFSLSMLDFKGQTALQVEQLELEQAKLLLSEGFESVVGHQSTADLFSSLLGCQVEVNRVSVTLSGQDQLLVGQYTGPRLEEGCKTLPEGAQVAWLLVKLL